MQWFNFGPSCLRRAFGKRPPLQVQLREHEVHLSSELRRLVLLVRFSTTCTTRTFTLLVERVVLALLALLQRRLRVK